MNSIHPYFLKNRDNPPPIECRSLNELKASIQLKVPSVFVATSKKPDLVALKVAIDNKLDIVLTPNCELSEYTNLNLPSLRTLYWPDPRIKDPEILNPSTVTKKKAAVVNPKFSIIIPYFENKERFSKAMKYWLRQSISEFELILVDDGSAPEQALDERELADSRISLIYIERTKKRTRGDDQFRAAMARNRGALNARGECLVFADSDILTQPQFLSQVGNEIANKDILMPRRWQLSQRSSEVLKENFSIEEDVVLLRGGHWENFQLTHLHKFGPFNLPWVWISTFCLCIKKSAFTKVGGFCPTFLSYGFEDTELAYRLSKQGWSFGMLDEDVFHLHQGDDRSEYKNSLETKKEVLKRSAWTFVANHPNAEVFEEMKKWL